MKNGRSLRWAAAIAAVFSIAVAIPGLYTMHSKLEKLSDTRRAGPMWIAVQLQIESLRFENTMLKFTTGDPVTSADDVRFRFDILWSRVDLALLGQEGVPAALESDTFHVIDSFKQQLNRSDATVQALDDDQPALAANLLAEFQNYSDQLRLYTLAAKEEQAETDRAARLLFFNMSRYAIILGAIVAFASMINAVLHYLESLHHKSMSTRNHELALSSEAAYVAKSEFISTISHELRTPLTSIKGSLAILNTGRLGILGEKAQGMIAVALRNSNRLERLINDILDFEQLEMNAMTYQFDTIDLGEVVSNSISANESFCAEYNVGIEADVPSSKVFVLGDETRLEQVLSNLISNAVKFSNTGDRVVIQLTAGETAEISVQDFGVGIDAKFQPHVFERFSQADSSETRRVGGSGLGLSITKGIVEAHDGTIKFETQPGAGTTFVVSLPLSKNGARQSVKAVA